MVKCKKSALKALTKGNSLSATRVNFVTDERNVSNHF